MWPFKKKTKKTKKTETEVVTVPEKTYAQWKQEYETLKLENAEREEQCAKDGNTWQEMLLKTKGIKDKMAYADKMMRKLQEPTLTYNKKWKGVKMELNKFIELAKAREIIDTDGEGYYSTETAKTDVIIRPSDIIEDIYRTDFPYVQWIPTPQV